MSWWFFIDNATGDLVSEGSVVPEGIDTVKYEVRDVGTRPDWTVKAWNPNQKVMFDRPIPILISRLDDIEAWLLADTDFQAVWSALSAARKTQIRTGLRRVLAKVLGHWEFRQEDERVEID